jgi:hypothetical protein
MSLTDLRDALEDLAGPLAGSVDAQRRAVGAQVRRRRLAMATSFVAAVLVVMVGIGILARLDEGNDGAERITASATTVHDDRFGYTATIPPGWAREPIDEDWHDPTVTTRPGDTPTARTILSVGIDHEFHPDVTRALFDELAPIQSELGQLDQELGRLAANSPEAQAVRKQIEALIAAEVEIRTRTDNLSAIQQQRSIYREQLATSALEETHRERIELQIEALNDAEIRIRARPGNRCTPLVTETGVHLLVFEGAYAVPAELASAPLEPRPDRFGPDSGLGSTSDPTWPPCAPQMQSMRFMDAGREFSFVLSIAAGTPRERRDEAYSILNSLRFDPTPTPTLG